MAFINDLVITDPTGNDANVSPSGELQISNQEIIHLLKQSVYLQKLMVNMLSEIIDGDVYLDTEGKLEECL